MKILPLSERIFDLVWYSQDGALARFCELVASAVENVLDKECRAAKGMPKVANGVDPVFQVLGRMSLEICEQKNIN